MARVGVVPRTRGGARYLAYRLSAPFRRRGEAADGDLLSNAQSTNYVMRGVGLL